MSSTSSTLGATSSGTVSGSNSDSSSSIKSDLQLGGVRKKNGHKENCKCPICINMMHDKKKTGFTDAMQKNKSSKNGHKANCNCPICKNMRKSEGKKKGGDGDGVTTTDGMSMTTTGMDVSDMDEQDASPSSMPSSMPSSGSLTATMGGKKTRKSRKSRKSRKTRKSRKSRKGRK
jgi:hypothetical protein